MKTQRFVWTLLLIICALAANGSDAEKGLRPNIIVVMGDDHAQWAMSAYGLKNLETPNLDWLAEQGVLFENAMSPAPVCSPARASFYTGKLPSQHGVHDVLRESPEFDGDWLSDQKLLSERLQANGYRTGLFGKWHATTDARVPQRGFDRWLSYDAFVAGWQNQYQHAGTVHFSSDGLALENSDVQARFLTEEAIRFIDSDLEKPFFVSLNFIEPHAPMEGLPDRLVQKYRGLARSIAPAGDSSSLAHHGSENLVADNHDEQFAQYLAAINLIDEQIGRLLDALQGRDLLDNTLVVYTSDHGLLVGQYGLYGKSNATNPVNFYEETLRIPLVVFGPERLVRAGQRRREFVDLLDLHETILDFSNPDTGYVPALDRPGKSMRNLLVGERNVDWRQFQYAERANSRMLTDGRWKLVRTYYQDDKKPFDTWFDLAHPFGERVASIEPVSDIRQHHIIALQRFFEAFESPQHSGKNIWHQPPPNPWLCERLGIVCPTLDMEKRSEH